MRGELREVAAGVHPEGRRLARRAGLSEPEYILFHRIAEPASARIRLRIVALGLKPRIGFLNAETDAHDDPRLGSAPTPALWDGHALTVGEDLVARRLAALGPEREAGC